MSGSVWESRVLARLLYKHTLERTHWTGGETDWSTARCPNQCPQQTVNKSREGVGEYEADLIFSFYLNLMNSIRNHHRFVLCVSQTDLLCGWRAVLHHVALQFSIQLPWRPLPRHQHLSPVQHRTHVNRWVFWHWNTKAQLWAIFISHTSAGIFTRKLDARLGKCLTQGVAECLSKDFGYKWGVGIAVTVARWPGASEFVG